LQSRPLVHIGFPKTATSWLQRYLFPNRDLGFSPLLPSSEHVNKLLAYPNELVFNRARVRQLLKCELTRVSTEGLIATISAERLSGAPHAGGYDTQCIATRIHAVMPYARIVVVIREQAAMVLSTYKQYLRAGGSCSLKRYLAPTQKGMGSMPAFYEFHRIIECYQMLFGRSNVLALPYELFRKHPQEFVSRVCRFSGSTAGRTEIEALPYTSVENHAFTPVHLSVRRLLNPYLIDHRLNPTVTWPHPKTKRRLDAVLTKTTSLIPRVLNRYVEQRWSTHVSSELGNRYRSSNACVELQTGLDLGTYGYCV
jgi:hypothetical protein